MVTGSALDDVSHGSKILPPSTSAPVEGAGRDVRLRKAGQVGEVRLAVDQVSLSARACLTPAR